MSEAKSINIYVKSPRSKSPWVTWLKMVVSTMTVFGPGLLLDSAAMQWAGFCILTIGVIAFATQDARKTTNLTINQARAYLNELEDGL